MTKLNTSGYTPYDDQMRADDSTEILLGSPLKNPPPISTSKQRLLVAQQKQQQSMSRVRQRLNIKMGESYTSPKTSQYSSNKKEFDTSKLNDIIQIEKKVGYKFVP
jgi:hypothetical protein